MDLPEFERAKTLLSAEQLAQLDEVQIGMWAVTTEKGLDALFARKTETIDQLLARHNQVKENSQVYRNGEGTYLVCILDSTQSSRTERYITYRISKITKRNLFQFQVLKLCTMLPEWYFVPFSAQYKEWHRIEVPPNEQD